MINRNATNFIISLPWKLPKILWQGKSGVFILDDDRRATISLSTNGTHDTYEGFKVQITSKTKGPIQSKYFSFNDYLAQRSDTRSDWDGKFSVISYCGWEWYIAIPKYPEHFTRAVEEWINAWI